MIGMIIQMPDSLSKIFCCNKYFEMNWVENERDLNTKKKRWLEKIAYSIRKWRNPAIFKS